MEQFLQKLQQYLGSLNIAPENIGEASFIRRLPMFVTAPYEIYTASVLNQKYVLAVSSGNDVPSPEQIAVQKSKLEEVSDLPVLFVFQDATREFCRLLIARNISFVVSGKQCFLPGGMVSLNEDKFSRPQIAKREKLSPLAQMIFLYCLQEDKKGDGVSFQDLISSFDLNKVYVSRTAKELESFRLAEIRSEGRNKSLFIDSDRKALWQKAQEFLINPVQKKIRLKALPADLPLAGISALSEYSNLNDDPIKTFAVYGKDFDIKSAGILEYDGSFLELWKYRPIIRDGVVDKLSLYLALKDDPDPRVQSELADMMEAIEW